MFTALTTIQAKYPTVPISLTLPVMPDGLTEMGKAVVRRAAGMGLRFYTNIMAMDYGGTQYAGANGAQVRRRSTSLEEEGEEDRE